MKKSTQPLFKGISTKSLQVLTTTVAETFAFCAVEPCKVFTTTDLWHIQRQGRVRPLRRFL
jgi:hypothetical protein